MKKFSAEVIISWMLMETASLSETTATHNSQVDFEINNLILQVDDLLQCNIELFYFIEAVAH